MNQTSSGFYGVGVGMFLSCLSWTCEFILAFCTPLLGDTKSYEPKPEVVSYFGGFFL